MAYANFFHHEHMLMLTTGEWDKCFACLKSISGAAYKCSNCYSRFHKSCAELPKDFQNPYHPHPLTMVNTGYPFKCIACLRRAFGYRYHCEVCKFDVDIDCALRKLTIDEVQDQLHHFTHLHPLVAVEKQHGDGGGGGSDHDGDGDNVYCKICGEPGSAGLCGCDPCNFYLHRSCANSPLPPTLQHFYHPCVLTLSFDRDNFDRCKACGDFCEFFSYSCNPCYFRMDIRCARLAIIMEPLGQQQIHHFSHGHPLKLREIELNDEILCSVCQKCCSGQTFVCCSKKCNFFLHNSCFNLPQNIHHPFHPHHPLTLYSPIQRRSTPECQVCCRLCSGFTYSCDHCKFHMHAECPVMTSTIKYQGHHHNIVFVDGQEPFQADADYDITTENHQCGACGSGCNPLTAMFRCTQCDFHLHFKCGPLPCLVKHEDHPCFLKLTDSPVMVDGADKNRDWFVCDVCEKDRDPRLPLYYCSNSCAFLVEIKCVFSEVLFLLRGGHGEVELRSAIFKHKSGRLIRKGTVKDFVNTIDDDTELGINPSLTMAKIWNALSMEEAREMRDAFEACAQNNNQDHGNWFTDNGDFACSDEDYIKFMASMDAVDHTTILAELQRCDKQVINVRSCWVTSDLAPILEDLCAKYGVIIPESIFQNSGTRTIFVHLLCETVRGMCTTRVVDISEANLFRWWRCLRTLKFVGFDVECAFNRLKRVVRAYYALRFERKVKNNCEQIDREIKELEEKLREMKQLEEKLMELKERHKSIEQPSPGSASSSFLAECLKEVSVLKWMRAGEGLL